MIVAAIIYLFLLTDITGSDQTYRSRSSKLKRIERYSGEKATFLPVTFTLSSTNVVIQSQLNLTEAKV